jgi:SAM-dependent methyltransferase
VAEDLGQLAAGVWGVAAVTACAELGILDSLDTPARPDVVAARAGISPALAERLLDVLVALGLAQRGDDGYAAAPGLAARSPAFLAADGAAGLLQAADLVRRAAAGTLGADGWRHTDELVLQAQGTISAAALPQLSRMFAADLERAAAFLDVGAGVGAISIGLCQTFPSLRAVGLEPLDAARALAEANVTAAGLADRIELREQLIEELEDVEAFDVAWLPLSFLPAAILPEALARTHRAMRPGGLFLTATHGGGADDLPGAAARLRAVLWRGEPIPPSDVESLLTAAGFTEVAEGRIPGSSLVPLQARRR